MKQADLVLVFDRLRALKERAPELFEVEKKLARLTRKYLDLEKACYFLLNYAMVVRADERTQAAAWTLLFSFELCTHGGAWVWAAMALDHLLFSFELCVLEAGASYTASLYMLAIFF